MCNKKNDGGIRCSKNYRGNIYNITAPNSCTYFERRFYTKDKSESSRSTMKKITVPFEAAEDFKKFYHQQNIPFFIDGAYIQRKNIIDTIKSVKENVNENDLLFRFTHGEEAFKIDEFILNSNDLIFGTLKLELRDSSRNEIVLSFGNFDKNNNFISYKLKKFNSELMFNHAIFSCLFNNFVTLNFNLQTREIIPQIEIDLIKKSKENQSITQTKKNSRKTKSEIKKKEILKMEDNNLMLTNQKNVENLPSNDTKVPAVLKVTDLLIYEHFTSTPYLMLAEIIDNSISSAISNLNKTDRIDLNIDIFFDKNNKTIKIIDNAKGMNNDQLLNCLQTAKTSYMVEKDSPLNRYGQGLKQAAFYLGKKMSIITKSKNNPLLTTSIDLIDKDLNEQIFYEITPKSNESFLIYRDFKYETGTLISLEKIKDEVFYTKTIDNMTKGYGSRYYFYLKRGVVITIHRENLKENCDKNIVPSMPKTDNLKFYYDNLYTNFKKGKNNLNFEEFLVEFKDQLSEEKNISNEVFTDFWDKAFNDKGLMWDVKFKILDNKYINGQIGILANYDAMKKNKVDQLYKNEMGFSLFQYERAVVDGPNTDGEILGSDKIKTMLPRDVAGPTNHKRRWFGWFSIDSIYLNDKTKGSEIISLNTNKSGITWNDHAAEENFKRQIEEFLNKYDVILKKYNELQNQYLKVRLPKTTNLVNTINDNTSRHVEADCEKNYFTIYGNDEPLKLKLKFPAIDENTCINLKLKFDNDTKDTDELVVRVIKQEIIELTININNKILEPLSLNHSKLNSNEITVIVKFCLAVMMTDLKNTSKEKMNNDNLWNIFQKIKIKSDSQSFLNMFNDFAGFISIDIETDEDVKK